MTEKQAPHIEPIPLAIQKRNDIVELGVTVILLSAEHDLFVDQNGQQGEQTTGLILFEKDGVVQKITFIAGKPFTVFEARMVVMGMAGWLELEIMNAG